MAHRSTRDVSRELYEVIGPRCVAMVAGRLGDVRWATLALKSVVLRLKLSLLYSYVVETVVH